MGQCPECGAKTSPDHAFCLVCGVDLGRGPAAPAAEETVPVSSVSAAASASAAPQAAGGGVRPSGPTGPRAQQARPRRAERPGTSVVPGLVALVVSVLFQLAITNLVPAEAYLHRLFRPSGGWIMGVVPALIAFAFVWTLADLFLKLRVARVNEGDLGRSDVRQLPMLVVQESAGVTLQRLRGWDAGMSSRPVGRRILWVLQHLETVDAQRAHELIRHQSDLEADSAASGYRTVKLFIWAMPILGFIGTVLGISLAVGGFSEFLTTNVSIDEIDAVTAELGNVASGLSFAFDTTLLGLLGGLVTSVVSSNVQSREERLLTSLDELGLRIMENATAAEPGRAPKASAASTAVARFDDMMEGRLEELSHQMERFTHSVQVGLDGFLGEWAKLPPEVERVAGDLRGLREHLSGAAKSTDQLVLETRVLLEGLNEASTKMSGRLNASIGSISQTVEGLGESLVGVSDSLSRGVVALTERVSASEANLHQGMTALQGAVDRTLDQSAAGARTQAATEQAMQRLSETLGDLGSRLEELRDAHRALAPVLRQLAGPMEIRLMPAMVAPPREPA